MRLFAVTLFLLAPVFATAGGDVRGDSAPRAEGVRSGEESGYIIQNDPVLKPTNIITIRAIGLGVGDESLPSRAQVMALAKRAAMIDAYRQLGEKMHGVKINSRDMVRDAMLVRSEVRTAVYSIVRGAEIVETIWDNNLCQVEMEVKLDGRRWHRILSGL